MSVLTFVEFVSSKVSATRGSAPSAYKTRRYDENDHGDDDEKAKSAAIWPAFKPPACLFLGLVYTRLSVSTTDPPSEINRTQPGSAYTYESVLYMHRLLRWPSSQSIFRLKISIWDHYYSAACGADSRISKSTWVYYIPLTVLILPLGN